MNLSRVIPLVEVKKVFAETSTKALVIPSMPEGAETRHLRQKIRYQRQNNAICVKTITVLEAKIMPLVSKQVVINDIYICVF